MTQQFIMDVAKLLTGDKFVAYNGLSGRPFTYKLTSDQLASAFEQMETSVVPECIWIAPTISPSDTSDRSHAAGYLEHPADVFDYYRAKGVRFLMAQEKLMGSRATILAVKGSPENSQIWSRTGRPFFNAEIKNKLMTKILVELETMLPPNWESALLDTEATPWGLKSGKLGNQVFRRSCASAAGYFDQLVNMGLADQVVPGVSLHSAVRKRNSAVKMEELVDNYLGHGTADPMQAVFNVFDIPMIVMEDGSGKVFSEVQQPAFIVQYMLNQMNMHPHAHLAPVKTYQIDLENEESCAWLTNKWLQYTEAGGEGFVFKTRQYQLDSEDQLILPAMKCRGREYMRLTYGVNYTEPEQFELFKGRQTGRKRMLSVVEYQLAISSLIQIQVVSSRTYDRLGNPQIAESELAAHLYKTKLHTLACEQDARIDIRL